MAKLIKASGEVVKLGEAPSFDQARRLVGGYLEVVTCQGPGKTRKTMTLLVDEDGGPRQLPLNMAASLVASRRIVGDVVLLENQGEVETTLGGGS